MQKSDAVRGIALFSRLLSWRIVTPLRLTGRSCCPGSCYLFCLRVFLSLAIGAAQSGWMEPAVRMQETASLTVL